MDDEGFLECTQALPDDWDADSDDEPHEQPELVAWLLVGDKKYEVYEGETKIGRDSASCAIVLSQKVLSKEHAALEITSGVHTLVDLGSMNKTRIGKMALKPHVRYALQGGESIRFGDVLAKYIIKPKAPCEDSGSETGSESMLQLEDPKDRISTVLNQEIPGLDTSNQVTSEPGTSKKSPEHTLSESAFVPETQEDKKGLFGIEFSPSGFHRTFIPESPSTSQSTPLQGRKASSVSETPGSASVIMDVTSNNDSFFFESSQPKNKDLKEKLIKTTENKGEVDYNSDVSTDVDEDIATQLFDDSLDDVTSTAKKSYTAKKDKYEEDLCFQPTQLFTGTDHQTGKDNADDTQDVLDAFDDNIEKQSLSTSRDEDDDYVPTQLFFDNESDSVFKKPATLAPKSKKRISGGQRASKVDDDLFEEYLLAPTQPYGECSKSKQTIPDEDDIYDVPTQLFSTDKVGENNNIKDREDMKKSAGDLDNDINSMSSQPKLFSSGKVSADVLENYGNSDKIADRDSSDNNENIFNQPTQPFMDEKDKVNDFFDAPTQVFEKESQNSKKKHGGNLVQESSKNRLEIMKTTVHCSDKDEPSKEQLAGDEEYADEEDLLPTQLFDTTKSSKKSIPVDSDDDDLLATQLFDHSEKSLKVSRNDDEDGKKSRIRSPVFQTPSKCNDVSDEELTPTQIFNPHKSAAKTRKRLVDNDDGLPPTQVFEVHYASKKTIESVDDDKFAPAQYFNCSESALKTPKSMLNDSLPPTQLYSTVSTVDNTEKAATSHELPAAQLYSDCNLTSDSPKPFLNRASTKPFTTEEKTRKSSVDLDDGGHLPTQPFADSNENPSMNMQSSDKTTSLPSKDEIITEAPTQPYINVPSVESSCTQKGPNMAESVKLQATEKGHMENIDEDATQDISFDGFIGVDNKCVLEQSLGKMRERKDIAWDHASDADSDASETLLNDDTLKDEDNTTNSKLELTKVEESNLLACDENNKKELSNIENYHSDESTDVEDELSAVKNLNEDGGQFSSVELTHDGGILTEDSSHAGKLSVENKESSSTAKIVDDIEPNMNIQNISSKQSITVTSTLQGEVMQNSNETEEMLALDVCLVDSQDETQVNESSVSKNISNLNVKSGISKEIFFPLSSDSDSEEDSFNVSQKIFDLTPNEKVNTPSSASIEEEAGSLAALSKAKRKLACSKEDSRNIHNYSDIEESPNKKRCNRAAKKNENKLEKQKITRSKLNTKKIVGISVLKNKKCPIGDKRLPDKQQCSNILITADKPGSDNDADKTLKISCRRTRKRTQGSLELLGNNSKRDGSRCKSPKLEAPEMELDHKSSKRLKSCDLEKNYTNQVPSRKLPTLSPVKNVKQEEKFGRQRQVPEWETMQSNSSTDTCREVTIDDIQEAQQSNRSCRYSISNNQNNQQLASKGERRNTRHRTVNPLPENQKELSSEKQRPENKTDKRFERNREISQEQKEISGVRRSRGRKSRVIPSEVEIQNNKEDFVEGKIHVRSSEKTDCVSGKPTVLQNKVDLIKKEEGSLTKHSSQREYRVKKPVASPSSVADSDVLNSNRNVDKVEPELKDEQINTTKTNSSMLVSKESLERTLTLTEEKMMDEKSDSTYECHTNRMATRGRKSALKEGGPSNEDKNRAASENLSKVRTSKRARRGPNKFSPDHDSQKSLCKKEESEMLKGTNSGYQNSENGRNKKKAVGNNENEDSKTSGDFSVPTLRRGGRTKKSQDGIDNNVKVVKENVIEQPRNHSEIRRGRASIATSQPSSVKSYPKTRSRFSILSGNIGNTRKQEGNTKSKVLQIEDKQKLPSAICKRGTNNDDKGETTEDDKGETSGHILESEDTQCFLKKKQKEEMLNIVDQGDSKDHSERRGMSTDFSEIDSEDSQGSVKRKGRKATEKLLSTPKCGKQELSVSNKILWSPSQRQLQASNRPRVLFTGYKDAQDEKVVLDLGGKVVESAQECTVLVTTAIKRTCKLLAVMGKGMPIVSPSWLSASKQARNFIDPWEFLVKDRESEVKFGFRLEQSLRSASKYQLFEGLEIHATKSVKPLPEQMKEIVECSGGQYLDMPPKRYAPQIRVVSCPEDKGLWTTFRRVGIPILGTEFILTGLLRHQLLLDEFVLM